MIPSKEIIRRYLACIWVAGVLAGAVYVSPKKSHLADSTLLLLVGDNRRGSGVHIGDDFILTAAHVVENEKTVVFKTDNSPDQYTADVLWVNKAYDIALLRSRATNIAQTMPLQCRKPIIGEHIKLTGNPLIIEFFHAEGSVGSSVAERSEWKASFVVSGAVGAGMSGGPITDDAGRLLGIIVAAPGQLAPFGLAVPVSSICTLMGRVS